MMHQHQCAACDQPLTCCCDDRRGIDRETGKKRRILCRDCFEMERLLKAYYAGDLEATTKLEQAERKAAGQG